ncbi:uncharacterized protein LOC125884924 [Epinephelus fuscoguttatus]|uniref:uncharacterized protein LOC125884924 n=1 Tax=Epinephelus fuscoguttatus TaxID=293821 RepID=UPI0020D175C9|nr:uncharacterized protein LOC125884924 [Epinephelus fuscoguttatus]
MMDQWKLWLVPLLPLCVCFDHEVTRVRTTVREEPYVAPLCSTDSLRKDSVILCRISKEMKRGEDCTMAYRQGKELQSDCDSRYTVITLNQTVYLHLASLTAVDSGNYTCRCPFPDGKDTLFLHMTVEEPSSSSRILRTTTILIGCAFIIGTGLILGHKLRKKYFRDNTRSGGSGFPTRATPFSLNQDDPDESYTSLQQPAGDLYQTVFSVHQQHDKWDEQEIDERETDQNIYQNV